jgi:hypothetical protein
MPPTVALARVQPTDGDGRVSAALLHIGEAAQPTSCPDQGRLDDGHRVAARRRVVRGRALRIRGPQTISGAILAIRMVSVTRKLGKSHLSRIGDRAKYPFFGATGLVAFASCLARGERPRQPTLRPAIGSLRRTRRQSGGQSGRRTIWARGEDQDSSARSGRWQPPLPGSARGGLQALRQSRDERQKRADPARSSSASFRRPSYRDDTATTAARLALDRCAPTSHSRHR